MFHYKRLILLLLLIISLSCSSDYLKETEGGVNWVFYTLLYLCSLAVAMFYYAKHSRRLKLNNTEALAFALWNGKCEVGKADVLRKLFQLDLHGHPAELLNKSFSIHMKKFIDSHRVEKLADLSALKRYIEKELA